MSMIAEMHMYNDDDNVLIYFVIFARKGQRKLKTLDPTVVALANKIKKLQRTNDSAQIKVIKAMNISENVTF